MVNIKKIEITAFGKFAGFEMEFEKGLCEFAFENEYGKSTIVDFMVFMLYGFVKTASKKRGLLENPLKKYMPWNDTGYIAGAMELEKDGALYRIERKQRESGRMALTVRDGSGAELSQITEPGEYLLGVDAATFVKTFLVRQTDMRFERTDGIVSALNNLVTTGDEQTSFDSAMEKLKIKKTKFQHGDMRRGRIFDIPQEITQLKLLKAELESKAAVLSESTAELSRVRSEILALKAKEQELQDTLETARTDKDVRTCQKILELEREIKKLESSTGVASKVDPAAFDSMAEVFDSYEFAKTKAKESALEKAQLEAMLSDLKSECPLYEVIDNDVQKTLSTVNGKGKINLALLIAGIVMVIAGGVLGAINSFLFALCALGAVAAVLAFVIRRSVEVPKDYGCDLDGLKKAYADYLRIKPEYDLTRAMLTKESRACEAATASLNELEKRVVEIKEKYGIENKSQLMLATSEAKNFEVVKSRIALIDTSIRELLEARPREYFDKFAGMEPKGDITVAEVERLILQNKNRISELVSRSAILEANELKIKQINKQVFETEQKITGLEKELEVATYENEVLDIAMKALLEAYDEINRLYSPILTQKASAPLMAFTDGKYDSVYLDRDFNIRVKADGELKDVGYFSKGTAEAIYFAVRHAVCELISDGAGVPIIMDDPFWALDSTRRKKALEYLKKLSEYCQIIIFNAK